HRAGGGEDPAPNLSMASSPPPVSLDERDHAHGHPVVPHVDVGLLLFAALQLADRLHEPGARRERSSREVRGAAVTKYAPAVGPGGVDEYLRADVVAHAGLLKSSATAFVSVVA